MRMTSGGYRNLLKSRKSIFTKCNNDVKLELMEKIMSFTEYFADVEATEEHKGYFCSVGEALSIVILGSLCGLKNISQIHQWATNERTKEFLTKHFGIDNVPCYYWMLCLLKLINPASLNRCFTNWVQSLLPDNKRGLTLSVDGKTVCSTEHMGKYKSPMHIVSAHIAELGQHRTEQNR